MRSRSKQLVPHITIAAGSTGGENIVAQKQYAGASFLAMAHLVHAGTEDRFSRKEWTVSSQRCMAGFASRIHTSHESLPPFSGDLQPLRMQSIRSMLYLSDSMKLLGRWIVLDWTVEISSAFPVKGRSSGYGTLISPLSSASVLPHMLNNYWDSRKSFRL